MKRTEFPRHYVFITQSGKPVIRLSRRAVWDIETQKLLPYEHSDYGHAITDGDLKRLAASGLVDTYDVRYVKLDDTVGAPLTASDNAQSSHLQGYYILTTLPASQLENVRSIIPQLGIGQIISAEISDKVIAIFNRAGTPFPTLHKVEDVLQKLIQSAPELFSSALVSLYEVTLRKNKNTLQVAQENLDTETSIITITSSSVPGKSVGIVGHVEDQELNDIYDMLNDLGMSVKSYTTGRETIPLIEDDPPSLLIVDLQLPDIHGWAFIKKLREVPSLMHLPIVVVSPDASDMLLALKIVKVHGFLVRPIDLTKLRERIQTAFIFKSTDS